MKVSLPSGMEMIPEINGEQESIETLQAKDYVLSNRSTLKRQTISENIKKWTSMVLIVRAISKFLILIKYSRIRNLTPTQINIFSDKSSYLGENQIVITQQNQQGILIRIRQISIVAAIIDVFNKIPVLEAQGRIVILWQIFILFLEYFLFWYLPFRYSFNPACLSELQYYWASYVVLVLFFIDFLINCKTAVYYKGRLIQSSEEVIKLYFKSGNMLLDFVTLILLLDFPSTRMEQLFFLIRITYKTSVVFKLKESFNLSNKVQASINLSLLFFKIAFLCHIIACIWFIIGLNEFEAGNGWLIIHQYQEVPYKTQYINSFFFSIIMLTSVKGNIIPTTDLEKVFAILIAFCGCLLFGYCINSIGIILRSINTSDEAIISQISQLTSYLTNHKVDKQHTKNAQEYLSYVLSKKHSDEVTHHNILQQLPPNLKKDILMNIYLNSLQKVPFLRNNFSNRCLEKLSLKVQTQFIGPDENFISRNFQPDQCLYIIFAGEIDEFITTNVHKNQKDEIKLLCHKKPGDVLGEYEFFTEQQKFISFAKSLGVSELHTLKLADLKEVLRKFPKEKEKLAHAKDMIIHNNRLDIISLKCFFCNETNHLHKNCPWIFPEQRKEQIIKKHQYQVLVERKQYTREINVKTKRVFNLESYSVNLQNRIRYFSGRFRQITSDMLDEEAEEEEDKEVLEIEENEQDYDEDNSEYVNPSNQMKKQVSFDKEILNIQNPDSNITSIAKANEESNAKTKQPLKLSASQSIQIEHPRSKNKYNTGIYLPNKSVVQPKALEKWILQDYLKQLVDAKTELMFNKIKRMNEQESQKQQASLQPQSLQSMILNKELEIITPQQQSLFDENFSTVYIFEIYFPHNNADKVIKQYKQFMRNTQRKLQNQLKRKDISFIKFSL